MKIKLIELIMLLLPIITIGQNISVQSFKHLPNDMDARVNHPKTDQNGDKCAIIKVVTTEQGFTWEGDMFGIVATEHKTAEYWLYVPHGAKRLTIKHPQLGVLRDYNYPDAIKEANVYELELTTAKVTTVVEPAEIPMQWLVIDSKPSGATVYINDELQSSLTPFTKKVQTGYYDIRLELANYHTYAEKINLTEESKQQKLIALRPAYGSVSVTSKPEEGAIIVLDGNPTNQNSPCVLNQIASGSYNIKIMKELYEVYEANIIVKDGETTIVNANLKPLFAEISVNTKTNAKLYDNGEFLNTDSWSGRLSEGVHQLEARLENHFTAKQTINVVSGEIQTIELIPEPITGKLDITTKPYGATIIIDGKQYGSTPNTVKDLIIGNHHLKLKKDGYVTFEKEIKIEQSKLLSIIETLSTSIDVEIISIPSNAGIYINNSYKGKTPLKLNLDKGEYQIRLEKEGYKAWQSNEKISSSNQDIEVNLEKEKYTLKISSSPNNAKVYINDTYKGKTPLKVDLIASNYLITVSKDKYQSERRNIDFNKDMDQDYTLNKVKNRKTHDYKSIGVLGISYTQKNLDYQIPSVGINLGWSYNKIPNFFTGFGYQYGYRNSDLEAENMISDQLKVINPSDYEGLSISTFEEVDFFEEKVNVAFLSFGVVLTKARLVLNLKLGGYFTTGYYVYKSDDQYLSGISQLDKGQLVVDITEEVNKTVPLVTTGLILPLGGVYISADYWISNTFNDWSPQWMFGIGYFINNK